MTHHSGAQDEQQGQVNTQNTVEVSRGDLPLSCPMPEQKLWNAHPRVFLPIEDNGQAVCPYCGTHYTLKDL